MRLEAVPGRSERVALLWLDDPTDRGPANREQPAVRGLLELCADPAREVTAVLRLPVAARAASAVAIASSPTTCTRPKTRSRNGKNARAPR
jgi:hypothetical protein